MSVHWAKDVIYDRIVSLESSGIIKIRILALNRGPPNIETGDQDHHDCRFNLICPMAAIGTKRSDCQDIAD